MNNKKKCVAMLLAGGEGSRLLVLTQNRAKPSVPFGGKYRIIDYPLSNCANSGIDTVGVLTQYQPLELNEYIGNGSSWDLDSVTGGAFVLPPYVDREGERWYIGTANAIFQNIKFIDRYDPDCILVLSGDHIYKMDYADMIAYHDSKEADATIAVIPVPMEEASRFGIMNTDEEGNIIEFEEKPAHPKSNTASMGIYVFNYKKIRQYLIDDNADPNSSHDFGKNIIPTMLNNGEKMVSYLFDGYWKDVGTIQSLWESNLEMIDIIGRSGVSDPLKIMTRNLGDPPHYLGCNSDVHHSLISDGAQIFGTVHDSVIFPGVIVEEGAVVEQSVVMGNTVVKAGAHLNKVVTDEGVVVCEDAVVGDGEEIVVLGNNSVVEQGATVTGGSVIECDAKVEK